MFSKCANPQCSVSFDYHLGGKYFRFHQSPQAYDADRNAHEVVHFWLCGTCAEKYTVEFDGSRCSVADITLCPIKRKEGIVIWYETREPDNSTQGEQEMTAAGADAQPRRERKVWG
jgi:hypothetical protein